MPSLRSAPRSGRHIAPLGWNHIGLSNSLPAFPPSFTARTLLTRSLIRPGAYAGKGLGDTRWRMRPRIHALHVGSQLRVLVQ
jgi:hypothetical protein